jgi:hypothetical protein
MSNCAIDLSSMSNLTQPCNIQRYVSLLKNMAWALTRSQCKRRWCGYSMLGICSATTSCSFKTGSPGQQLLCEHTCVPNLCRCDKCHWAVGQWSNCSGGCGTGLESRSVQCMRAGKAMAAGASECGSVCLPENAPPATQLCTAAPPSCQMYLWQTGPWSACQAGQSNRHVGCIDARGTNASVQVGDVLPDNAPLLPMMPCPIKRKHQALRCVHSACCAGMRTGAGAGASGHTSVRRLWLLIRQRLPQWGHLQQPHGHVRVRGRLRRPRLLNLAGPLRALRIDCRPCKCVHPAVLPHRRCRPQRQLLHLWCAAEDRTQRLFFSDSSLLLPVSDRQLCPAGPCKRLLSIPTG